MRASSSRCATTVPSTAQDISEAPALLKWMRSWQPGVASRTAWTSIWVAVIVTFGLAFYRLRTGTLPRTMGTGRRQVGALPLIGGELGLDLVNSIDPRHAEPRDEFLGSYRALVEWAVHAGVVAGPLAAGL